MFKEKYEILQLRQKDGSQMVICVMSGVTSAWPQKNFVIFWRRFSYTIALCFKLMTVY